MKGHLAAAVFGLLVCSSVGLNILSFNIRQFGAAKYGKQDIVDVLINIVKKYDLIFVMELVDSTEELVLSGFVQQLNNRKQSSSSLNSYHRSVENQGFMFDYVVSERVGRTNYKEQYATIFRTNVVRVKNTSQFQDNNDVFQRPPFSVYIETIDQQSGDLPPFFLIVSHTQPTDTANEINGLLDVYNHDAKYYGTSAGMILGDLNADCSYLSNTRYNTLDLILNTSFTWWIDKDADTTSGATNCAYDRIITSSSLTPYVVNGSIDIIDFGKMYNLSSEFTADVSDHNPVAITLKGMPYKLAGTTSAATVVQGSVILWTLSLLVIAIFYSL